MELTSKWIYLILVGIVLISITISVYLYLDANKIKKDVQLGQLQLKGRYPEDVKDILITASDELVSWPRSASIGRDGKIQVEKVGRILDLTATMNKIKLSEEGQRIKPVFATIAPELTSREIQSLTKPIGVYTTYVSGSEERYHNIKVAGKFINYWLVMPREVFSFNDTVGAPLPEKGYKEAPIIVDDKMVPGYGGGICQVSTTLYNAILKANLKIEERHAHSKDVNYVPEGKDATVAYDYLDFKFRNDRDRPVMIRVWAYNRRLTIGIYGI